MSEVNRKLKICTKNGEYSDEAANRSILTVCWDSNNTKTAIAIGINPSKANDNRSDKTLTTLARFLAANDYKEFKMLNIFQSYSTQQDGIKRTTVTDFETYKAEFQKADTIFIVWGISNQYRNEKKQILQFFKQFDKKLFCLEKNNRYPLHPSRMSYDSNVIKYNVGE
jgi:hypothetical protein